MNLVIWIVLFFLLFGGFFGGLDDTKLALAEDIKSGALCITGKAFNFIKAGDSLLGKAELAPSWEGMMARAFTAKVYYERARLEMEIKWREGVKFK